MVSIDTAKKPDDQNNCLNQGDILKTMNTTSKYISDVIYCLYKGC